MKSLFHSMRKTGTVKSAAQEAAQKKWQEAGAIRRVTERTIS